MRAAPAANRESLAIFGIRQLFWFGLKMLPSEYFRRQCWISFDPDETMLAFTAQSPLCGADRIIWASDYPHPDAKFPGVTEELTEALDGLSYEQKRQITSESSRALYGGGLHPSRPRSAPAAKQPSAKEKATAATQRHHGTARPSAITAIGSTRSVRLVFTWSRWWRTHRRYPQCVCTGITSSVTALASSWATVAAERPS